jgi:hypothetical protein
MRVRLVCLILVGVRYAMGQRRPGNVIESAKTSELAVTALSRPVSRTSARSPA